MWSPVCLRACAPLQTAAPARVGQDRVLALARLFGLQSALRRAGHTRATFFRSTHTPCAPHQRRHRAHRVGWLRAMLGANDDGVSTASLVIGVSAAHATHASIMLSGVARLVAGAMSMAAGSMCRCIRRPTPNAPTSPANPPSWPPTALPSTVSWPPSMSGAELDATLAKQVAVQLMARRAGCPCTRRAGHLRHPRCPPGAGGLVVRREFCRGGRFFAAGDGSHAQSSSPFRWWAGRRWCCWPCSGRWPRAGGAPIATGAGRVAFWGVLAMAVTAGVGALFGAVV